MRIISRGRRRRALRRREGFVIFVLEHFCQRVGTHPPPADVARVQLHHFEAHPLELPHPHRLHAFQLAPVAASEVMVGLVDEDCDDILVDCLCAKSARNIVDGGLKF